MSGCVGSRGRSLRSLVVIGRQIVKNEGQGEIKSTKTKPTGRYPFFAWVKDSIPLRAGRNLCRFGHP